MVFIAVVEYAILASTFTLAKVAVSLADPLFLIGVRMIMAAPLMFLIQYCHDRTGFKVKKSDIKRFLHAGIFHIFLPFTLEFWALQYVSSAKTAITFSLTPFIAAILAYLLHKKKISMKQTTGLLIGMLGLMPIFFSRDEVAFVAGEFLHVSVPELVLLFSVISASYAWFIIYDLMRRGYGISLINGIAMLIGGCLSMALWAVTSDLSFPIKGDIQSFIIWTSLLVLVANVISYNLYGWLLRHLSITFMSAIGFLCPIFASIYGVFLLGENLGLSHLFALILVSLGLWLFYRDEMRKNGRVLQDES